MKMLIKIVLAGSIVAALQLEARTLSIYNEDPHGEYTNTIRYGLVNFNEWGAAGPGLEANLDENPKIVIAAGQKGGATLDNGKNYLLEFESRKGGKRVRGIEEHPNEVIRLIVPPGEKDIKVYMWHYNHIRFITEKPKK